MDVSNVLVVDDDPVSRVVITSSLSAYRVISTSGVDQAWDELVKRRFGAFDLVICDVVLHENDSGFRLVSRMSEDDTLSRIPVIMISASFQTSSALAKAHDFVSKPVDRELLRRKAEQAITYSRQRAREASQQLELRELKEKLEGMNARVTELMETPVQAAVKRLASVVDSLDVLRPTVVNHDRAVSPGPSASPGQLAEQAAMNGMRRAKAEIKSVIKSLAWNSGLSVPNAATLAMIGVDPVYKSILLETIPRMQVPLSPTMQVTRRASAPELPEEVSILGQWSFDPFKLTDEESIDSIVSMFGALGLIDTFRMHPDKIASFARAVRDKQHADTPYHGWMHAVDVAQSVFWLLTRRGITVALSPVDRLVIMVASVFHDVDHPGTTNQFQVNIGSDLALRYNDISVLENHHASTGFRILGIPACNMLEGLSRGQFQAVRKRIIDLILATDMARHSVIISEWKARQSAPVSPRLEGDDPVLCQSFLQLVIKVADISNSARPWGISHEWSHRICHEFNEQAKAEKRLGLPVTRYMDPDVTSVAKMSRSFNELTAVPAVTMISELIPEASELLRNLAKNLRHWEDIDSGVEICPHEAAAETTEV